MSSQKNQPKSANVQGGRIYEKSRVIEGEWPVETPFETKEQLNEYFGQIKITCLLCGRKLHTLAKHLVSVHGLTADQYREKYGIPWSYGLSSPSASNNYSKALKKRIAMGDKTLSTGCLGEIKHTGPRERVRPICAANKRDNFLKLAKLTSRLHVEDDGSLWSQGPTDRSRPIKTILCSCGKTFAPKSAFGNSAKWCLDCAHARRLARKKMAREKLKSKE